jgi:hypothetical protein
MNRPPDKEMAAHGNRGGHKKGSLGRRTDDKNNTDRRVKVFYQKHSGAMLEYGRYHDRAEADQVVRLLRWAGAVAHVEVDGAAA